jgi:hypothetical protein
VVTTELRLKLSALRGDSNLSLAPRRIGGEPSPATIDGLIDRSETVARINEAGFSWDSRRDIFVRKVAVPLSDLGLSAADFSPGRLGALSAVVPTAPPLTITFFDLETTGLQRGTATVPFLYGWSTLRGEELTVEQWLLPELGQEAPLVRAALDQIKAASLLVTYNGASYDLPLLRTRMVMAGVDRAWPATPHLDLLPVVRRLFRHRLDRCSLRRVEEALLQQPRSDDIPGGEAPARYWQFLSSGDPAPIIDVVRHNQQDVVSLARVLDHLARHLELEEPLPSDWLSLGRFIEARGDLSGADGVYRRAERFSPPPLDRAAALRRARLLRRQGLEDEARQAWLAIWERWHDPEAAEAVCIDLEHRQRDPAAALELVREVLREAPVGWDQRFVRRMWRLQGRLGVSALAVGSQPVRQLKAADSKPWSGWLPGGESYEAWLALRRGGRRATQSPGSMVGLAKTAER